MVSQKQQSATNHGNILVFGSSLLEGLDSVLVVCHESEAPVQEVLGG